MKTFCGILLCCLDASTIIKRNGIEYLDFSWIVKYAHLYTISIVRVSEAAVTYQLTYVESFHFNCNDIYVCSSAYKLKLRTYKPALYCFSTLTTQPFNSSVKLV